MDSNQLLNLLEIAKNASIEAGNDIIDIYESDDFDVEIKGDESPLTKADKASHNRIVGFLENTEIPILSEEGKEIQFAERSNWEYFWMIDPLDGTKEFIKRNGEFTVNIALIHENQSILGVVYTPVQKKLYFGLKGHGSFLQEGNNDPVKLEVSKFAPNASELRVVASRSHLNDDTQRFLDDLKNPKIVSMGSSLKFMVVAEGNAEFYPRYAPTMEWDTAAAQIVVEEAGGTVIQADSGNQVKYNKEDLLNPYFLVSGQGNSKD